MAAAATDDDFLPRLLAVFYASFHPTQGPKVDFQVPEGSITPQTAPSNESTHSITTSRASSVTKHQSASRSRSRPPSRSSGRGAESARADQFDGREDDDEPDVALTSPVTVPPPPPLFDFDSVSEYIIPRKQMCGRLVACTTRKFKILGFPVLLEDDKKYRRNVFIFNLCFVFDRRADLVSYEPIVRKCARVLKALEEESSFLSDPKTAPKMYGTIEQLFEDLNSYCESFVVLPSSPELPAFPTPPSSTQVPVQTEKAASAGGAHDGADHDEDLSSSSPPAWHLGRTVNALNLKLFPSYPNPPPVHDWQVPIALINLEERVDKNWDLTMARISPYVDGINHVKRISEVADVENSLTRQCMEHLLYYGCIIMVDIFQFSNMYAVRPLISRLAEDETIRQECGNYVTRPGFTPPPYPTLLALYSFLRPGTTVHDWIEDRGVDSLGIDARRFISFGVIKGLLRRVHRYPVLLSTQSESGLTRGGGTLGGPHPTGDGRHSQPSGGTVPLADAVAPTAPGGSETAVRSSRHGGATMETHMDMRLPRWPSAGRRDRERSATSTILAGGQPAVGRQHQHDIGEFGARSGSGKGSSQRFQKRQSRPYPSTLPGLLDGSHHTDELCVRYGISLPELERMLALIGGVDASQPAKGTAEGDGFGDVYIPNLGQVRMILR